MAMTLPLALAATAFFGLATAQSGSMSLCTGDDCGYCPNSVTTDGTGCRWSKDEKTFLL